MTSLQRQLAVSASHLFQRKRNPPIGARPGTLALPADSLSPVISLMRYDAEHLEERRIENVDELDELLKKGAGKDEGVCWIDVQGFGDGTVIERVRELFELHPLAVADAVNALIREESDLVSHTVRQYLRDCYDHAVQTSDAVETFRDLAANLMDLYLSSVSQRTNEVMKVLTIITSIFIPLSFLAGIYGMNFTFMPELHMRWAYPMLLLVMFAIAVGMLWIFHIKGWIGRSR